MKPKRRYPSGLPGWIELCSDINWIDYHGMWARKARDGAWYVLRWTNLLDAGGKEFSDTPYECDVKRLHFGEISAEEVASALRSCGWELEGSLIVDSHGEPVASEDCTELVKLEACIQYGHGSPLESFTGKTHPTRIRAEARRYAETCMRDAALVARRLARPVNAIGSTAQEYGTGRALDALDREPFDDRKQLVRKLYGMGEGS